MAQQVVTPNLNLSLPGDDSHNTPWGACDQLLATAINMIDSAIVSGVQSNSWRYAVDAGSAANIYAGSYIPPQTLQAGVGVYLKAAHANTGASTFAINGGATKPITKTGGVALVGGEILSGQIIQMIYDGTEWQLISQ
jgi:hypothetical protein